MFTSSGTKPLSEYLKNHATPIKWKKYALLGQALLRDFACIQLRGFMAVFQPEQYAPTNGWDDLAVLRSTLVDENPALLPERFEDLEDEDHDFVDDEEYCSVLDMECIDENED